MNKKKQFAVIGLGRFGSCIARTLFEEGYDVLACDEDHNKVQDMAQSATVVAEIDVADSNAMAELGLGNFDVVIIAIGSNLEANLLASIYAKEIGVKYVISRATTSFHKKILEKIGVDQIIQPELEMGSRLAFNLTTSNVLDYINISNDFTLAEISPDSKWIGRSVKDANIYEKTGLNVMAIKRSDKIIASKLSNVVMEKNDIVIVMGEMVDIHRFVEKNRK